MALPKKFNETINFKNRVESLNDLTFYSVIYDYKLTEDYKDHLHGEFDLDGEVTGFKEVSALDEEQAKAKIENWFNVLIKNQILETYDIKSVKVKSFYETLKDKKILDILEYRNPQ